MRALGQLSRHDLPVFSGAGPCQLPKAGGTAPWGGPGSEREEEDEDQEQHPQQHRDGTPLSAVWGQEGQSSQRGGSTPPHSPTPGDSPLVMWDILAIFLRTPSIRDWVWSISCAKASSMLPRPGRHQLPEALCTPEPPAMGSWPTPRVPVSHALLVQLLPNAAGHVFQN